MDNDPNRLTLHRSLLLSQPYWAHYEQLIGPTNFKFSHQRPSARDEYLAFIEVTRRHQAERDRLKQKQPLLDLDEYYKDISQVCTLVEDNLVEAPVKDGESTTYEQQLIKLYGEAYDKIRSMEIHIDGKFNRKLQELSPEYWPVMPINPKPYLNPLK